MALYQQHKFTFMPFCLCCILLVPERYFGSYKRPVKNQEDRGGYGDFWQEIRARFVWQNICIWLGWLSLEWTQLVDLKSSKHMFPFSRELKDHIPLMALKMKMQDIRRQKRGFRNSSTAFSHTWSVLDGPVYSICCFISPGTEINMSV